MNTRKTRLISLLICCVALPWVTSITFTRTVAARWQKLEPGLDTYQELEFLNFLGLATKNLDLTSMMHKKVPSLSDLDLYLWESDPQPIFMPYNDHILFYESNRNEVKIIQIMRNVLKKGWVSDSENVILDMGINDGYIAALAAAYGYQVVAVDAQPECVRRFAFAKAVNGWHRVKLFNNIVLSERKSMSIPNGICGGGSRFQGEKPNLNTKRGITSDITGSTDVSSTTVDLLVPAERVLLFHLDVEGAELSVLQSASQLLIEKRLVNLIWEFAPHRWAESRDASMNHVLDFMANFLCIDVRSVSLPIKSFPEDDSNIIKDWSAFYEEVEQTRTITDIWCYSRPKE
jgi:FkbM family methyltransferase